jgi:hypothetical protein
MDDNHRANTSMDCLPPFRYEVEVADYLIPKKRILPKPVLNKWRSTYCRMKG